MSTSRTRARPLAGSIISANGIGTKCPACMEIITPLPPGQQVLGGAVAEIARVLHVVRNRIGAAQLVADVLGHDGRLDAELPQPLRHLGLQDLADVDLVDADVAVGVALDVVELRQVFRARCRGRALRR